MAKKGTHKSAKPLVGSQVPRPRGRPQTTAHLAEGSAPSTNDQDQLGDDPAPPTNDPTDNLTDDPANYPPDKFTDDPTNNSTNTSKDELVAQVSIQVEIHPTSCTTLSHSVAYAPKSAAPLKRTQAPMMAKHPIPPMMASIHSLPLPKVAKHKTAQAIHTKVCSHTVPPKKRIAQIIDDLMLDNLAIKSGASTYADEGNNDNTDSGKQDSHSKMWNTNGMYNHIYMADISSFKTGLPHSDYILHPNARHHTIPSQKGRPLC